MPPPVSTSKTVSLTIRAFRLVVTNLVFLPLVLFVPAGTLQFWQAWAFLAVIAGYSVCTVVYYLRRNPQALERRLSRREPLDAQRVNISFIKILHSAT